MNYQDNKKMIDKLSNLIDMLYRRCMLNANVEQAKRLKGGLTIVMTYHQRKQIISLKLVREDVTPSDLELQTVIERMPLQLTKIKQPPIHYLLVGFKHNGKKNGVA